MIRPTRPFAHSLTRRLAHAPTLLSREGFTLIEVVVVLILLAVSAGVVMPMLRAPARAEVSEPELAALLRTTRQTAAERAQVLELVIDVRGGWLVVARSDGRHDVLSTGTLKKPLHTELTISFSPFGSCAVVASDGMPLTDAGIDPLSCVWKAQYEQAR